mgnify:CR=1 FL=1
MSDPPHSERVAALARLANLLDASFRVPGTHLRFGLDPVLGLIPGLGDLLSGAAATWILIESWRLGARPGTLGKMALNIGLDFLVGAVPLVGDLADFAMKPNQRNIALLIDDLDGRLPPPS